MTRTSLPYRPTTWALALLLVPLTCVLASACAKAEPAALGLEEAVTLALAAADPEAERFSARAEALESLAVADAQLPDPRLTGQVANVPVDSFNLDDEGMTQALRLGLRQEFPAGDTRAIRGARRLAEAEVARARRDAARRDIALATRRAWLDLAYRQRAIRILERSREAIGEQLDSMAARFATGQMHAQDVLRTELELSLLEDRTVEQRRHADLAREALARYTGRAAFRPLPAAIPRFPDPADTTTLEGRLVDHPRVRAAMARLQAADLDIDLADEAYKPVFAFEGSYGVRTDRADLASVGITLSLPLFPDKRQDRERVAAVRERSAEAFERDRLLRDLRRELEQALASWRRLGERIELYRNVVSERAEATAAATVNTYANSQTDFAELIRSQLAELDVRLKQAELESETARTWARLTWLTGDPT